MRDQLPEGWTIVDVVRGGEVVGFFCTSGPEIHCWREETHKGRWLTRQDLERLTRPLFHLYGRITTKVRIGNEQGHRFVTRLGFVPVGADSQTIHYECKRLRHARN